MGNAIARTKIHVMRLKDTGTITTGDSKDFDAFPYQLGEIVGGLFILRANGSSSGATTVMLNKTHEDGTAAADILSAVMSIAHDASAGFVRMVTDNLDDKTMRRGDTLRLDVDAIPGGSDSAGIHIFVFVRVMASNA